MEEIANGGKPTPRGRPKDSLVIHGEAYGTEGPVRYSKEITGPNAKRRDELFLFNVRVDYRRSFKPFDVVACADLVNVTGAGAFEEAELNIGRGTVVEGGLQALLGRRFERSW